MKKLLRIYSLLCCMALMVACGGGATEEVAQVPGVTDSTIVLGSWGPLTGPAALWGSVPHAMDAYFKMVNEEGGIHGRQIKFVYKDDGYDPTRTVPAVREMVEKDEVFAFVGGIGTATGMAVKDYILENEIPWINPCSGASHFTYPTEKNIFSAFTLYFDEAEVQVDYAVNTLGATKIGIIYQNDDFGGSALVSARNALKAHNIELVAEAPCEVIDSDLSAQISSLKAAGAEVVLLWTAPKQAAISIGTAAAMSYQPQWIASAVLSDMSLMHNITKGGWEGVIFSYYGYMPTDTSNATVNKYRDVLAKHHPDVRWGAFSASGFLYAEPLGAALKNAGRDLTRASLVQALEGLQNFQGVGPSISFSQESHQGNRALFLVKCKTATDYEKLTDYIDGKADIARLVEKLGAS